VPLTPSDVANKQFKVGFRGYALEEVDAFLDEVESEIARLLREVDTLKQEPPAAPAPVAAPAPEPVVAARVETPAAEEPITSPGMQGQEAALRTLLLAQRTADEAVAEARAEAAQIVEAARAEAEQLRSSAHEEAERTTGDAHSTAERELEQARAEAERLTVGAREELARSEAELATLRSSSLGDLEHQRGLLEGQVEELRAFEREYRSRLKAYLQTQLSELDGTSGGATGGPVDLGKGGGIDGLGSGEHHGALDGRGPLSGAGENAVQR
jgi:DivIVA domain-containing protein